MHFTIDMTTDNAVFADDAGTEVGRILEQIADQTRIGGLRSGMTGAIFDSNGNRIGNWELSPMAYTKSEAANMVAELVPYIEELKSDKTYKPGIITRVLARMQRFCQA